MTVRGGDGNGSTRLFYCHETQYILRYIICIQYLTLHSVLCLFFQYNLILWLTFIFIIAFFFNLKAFFDIFLFLITNVIVIAHNSFIMLRRIDRLKTTNFSIHLFSLSICSLPIQSQYLNNIHPTMMMMILPYP